ncbi:uncharacterized protein LOC18441906 [Amborella trichopoda]|uniref:Xylanase inhibitor C-terminal domain-containing protein n=1 Tax=Amborella trichopoda TaxID=13333 RepID=W1Q0T5_AMBTC|nr:uncharacterized protein LOC18441906 [Amborella trichopoda]ERN13660.1 hypothetical protein AMTR_s00049p00114530 [Amborella trichopoda]|eukprot:XP_006852193.1 uncharacterized protein LOC18441906 [Amborella trichopoda]
MGSFSLYPSSILSLVFLLLTHVPFSDQKTQTIYDVLRSNGLPIGLLPKTVSNYSIDKDGNFEVHLEQACYAKFENQVHYKQNITGTLSYGQIGALSGVLAQELFLWFPVKCIRVDVPSSGLIYFDVGVIYKQFSLALFETPPDCTAMANGDQPDLHEGGSMADALSESQLGKSHYEADQDILKASQ